MVLYLSVLACQSNNLEKHTGDTSTEPSSDSETENTNDSGSSGNTDSGDTNDSATVDTDEDCNHSAVNRIDLATGEAQLFALHPPLEAE